MPSSMRLPPPSAPHSRKQDVVFEDLVLRSQVACAGFEPLSLGHSFGEPEALSDLALCALVGPLQQAADGRP